MPGTIIWIPADHSEPVLKEEAVVAPDLERMKAYVGGFIEVVHVLYFGKPTQMVANEEGLLIGLPFNMRATSLYHLNHIHTRGEFPDSPIVGNAIVLHDLPLE